MLSSPLLLVVLSGALISVDAAATDWMSPQRFAQQQSASQSSRWSSENAAGQCNGAIAYNRMFIQTSALFAAHLRLRTRLTHTQSKTP